MVDLRNSSYLKHGVFPPDDYGRSRTKSIVGFGSGRVSGRTYGIGSFLNNYDLSVEQMAAVDPLPLLVPLKPFPELPAPEDDTRLQTRNECQVERWPCEFPKSKRTTRETFHRRKDWMHDWAVFMYTIGECGAKIKK